MSQQGFWSKGVKINNFSAYEESSGFNVENKLEDERSSKTYRRLFKKEWENEGSIHNEEWGQNLGYICEIKMYKIRNQLDWKEKKKWSFQLKYRFHWSEDFVHGYILHPESNA